MTHVVSLRARSAGVTTDPPDLTDLSGLAERAAAAASAGPDGRPDLHAALRLAGEVGRDLGPETPDGAGHAGHAEHAEHAAAVSATLARWSALATLGAVDLTVARAVEPHLDALAILHEAGEPDLAGAGTWGVYAAEGPRRLHAEHRDGAWVLHGEKPWCSLADVVDHALVTAWAGEERGLFAIDLHHPGVVALDGPAWVSRGLTQVRSTGLGLDGVPARPVGALGWYLQRPGFWRGGIGVAAVWFGAAVAVARRLRDASLTREPDQVGLAHLGRVDAALVAARAVLREAATDAPQDGAQRALRVRQVVADAVDVVLREVDRALGPAPLALEEEHARRVADLRVYVRQHHGDRDLARQGERALAGTPW